MTRTRAPDGTAPPARKTAQRLSFAALPADLPPDAVNPFLPRARLPEDRSPESRALDDQAGAEPPSALEPLARGAVEILRPPREVQEEIAPEPARARAPVTGRTNAVSERDSVQTGQAQGDVVPARDTSARAVPPEEVAPPGGEAEPERDTAPANRPPEQGILAEMATPLAKTGPRGTGPRRTGPGPDAPARRRAPADMPAPSNDPRPGAVLAVPAARPEPEASPAPTPRPEPVESPEEAARRKRRDEALGEVLPETPPRKAFKGARRYSRFVRLMKFVLPIVAFALVAVIATYTLLYTTDDQLTVTFANSPTLRDDRSTLHPTYTADMGPGQVLTVKAERAEPSTDNPREILLRGLKADLQDKKGSGAVMSAENGRLALDDQAMILTGSVTILSEMGYEFRTEHVKIDFEEKTVRGEEPVTGTGPAGTIRANGFSVIDNGRTVRFESGVVMQVEAEPLMTAPAAPAPASLKGVLDGPDSR